MIKNIFILVFLLCKLAKAKFSRLLQHSM